MKVMRFLAVGAALALAACSKPATPVKAPEAAPAAPPLMKVNDKPISNQLFEDYVKAMTQGKSASELSPEDRDQLKEELARMELVAQQAEKDGLTKDPEVASHLELTRLNLLQQAAAQRYLKERTPTEAEMRAEFDAQLASTPMVEYHARHILVSSADTAQKIIEQLGKGGDFATLARRFSSDKGSAAKGGDLDWFSPGNMVKPFGDAVGLLKKGEITQTPVQTQYGWHVIQLLGTRDRAPPSFDAVQDQLKRILLTRKFRAYQDEMLKTAKIEPALASMPAAATPGTAAAPAAAPAASTPASTTPANPPAAAN
ncbi:MAG TPA: peptidylprolyl isomerase [Steroidobacteraceae bacterium]|nr:peptidylprolyl isomerase [Steroidobacteraceae bacterium]